MSNSLDPDETAHYEPSHLDLCCSPKFFYNVFMENWRENIQDSGDVGEGEGGGGGGREGAV